MITQTFKDFNEKQETWKNTTVSDYRGFRWSTGKIFYIGWQRSGWRFWQDSNTRQHLGLHTLKYTDLETYNNKKMFLNILMVVSQLKDIWTKNKNMKWGL